MSKLIAISVRSNAYADNVGWLGKCRMDNFPSDWDALEWLSTNLATGNYVLSSNSKYSLEDVRAHEQKIANTKGRK